MSSRADADDSKGGRDHFDVLVPTGPNNEGESGVDVEAWTMSGDGVQSTLADAPRLDNEMNYESEAEQLEEDIALPPGPSTSTSTPGSEPGSNFSPDAGLSSPDSPDSIPSSGVLLSDSTSGIGSARATPLFNNRLHPHNASTSSASWDLSSKVSATNSRRASLTSQTSLFPVELSEEGAGFTRARPWEVVRWSKLKKMSHQTFSKSAKRTFGSPTFLTIGAYIAVGTSNGTILLFDYQQSLKAIIGQGTPAADSGAILALAISADHSTIAAGHTNGSIFTWDLSQPSKPFLNVPPLSRSQLANRKSDGHVINSAILHIGFLGHRHTALVSADESGMAFSHLASRGLGSLGRNVKTTRILGRYPDLRKPEKPTSVLAFAPLPLGNVTQATDNMGLTALLTPFLLVIVSTTPVAQTHFKLQRTKDATSHITLTGCVAWFPAVKLKDTSLDEAQASSNTKLVYCWSNVLSLLEVETVNNVEVHGPVKTPELSFEPRGLWKSDEAILAVQWMSRSIIAVLTITQRLVILTDNPLRVAESSDLNSKQIYHQDIFSRQLLSVVDKVGGETSTQDVVPDAYYMSFKAYKGRLFLLGTNDISLGTLSNWADRLMSLMEAGNPISAIELATSYYNGETNKITLGLPRDDVKRHSLVKNKILELLSGSLRYIFNDDEHRKVENEMRSALQELARVSFSACISIGEVEFLFNEVYDWFSDSSVQDIFLYELEHHIMQHNIDTVPTMIIKDFLVWYASHDLGARLEKIICTLQTDTMAIDDVSSTCMRLQLYDALISVWNRAFNDYVTPLIHIMSIVQNLGDESEAGSIEPRQRDSFAIKLFLYVTFTLTGRRYPDGSDISPGETLRPKGSLYGFIFANKPIPHPRLSGSPTLLLPDGISKRSYPYLRCLLRFDSHRFMSMLHEIFEDNFLNGDEHQLAGAIDDETSSEQAFGMSINRQRIVNILLEVITAPDFGLEETIHLDIFLARNLPKYSQFILLSGSSLRQILIELCNNPRENLRDECQLSVEYLLSTYQPPDLSDFIPLFAKARYFRILKSTYRSSKQFARWLGAYFEDPEDKVGVFTCIGDCLRPSSGLSKRQCKDVKAVIAEHMNDLAEIDVFRAAHCLQIYAPQMLDMALDSLGAGSHSQFLFLQATLESPSQEVDVSLIEAFCEVQRDAYVRLMCKYSVQHVADYVGLLGSGDVHLDAVLPAMEESGAVDAAIIVLTRNGLAPDAMHRLLNHLRNLQAELLRQCNFEADSNNDTTIAPFLEDVQKYVKIGIWLCQHASSSVDLSSQPVVQLSNRATGSVVSNFSAAELLWLDLIDGIVGLSQAVHSTIEACLVANSQRNGANKSASRTTESLRQTVQQAFTALLAITAQPPKPHSALLLTGTSSSNQVKPVRFLDVLAAFIARLTSRTSSISSVRSVLDTIFSAYLFESSMLALANALLEKDVFAHVAEAEKNRRVGWGPRSQLCEGCKRRAWGASTGAAAWEAWQHRKATYERLPRELPGQPGSGGVYAPRREGQEKGKGRDSIGGVRSMAYDEMHEAYEAVSDGRDGLVVFSCMHIFHRACLEAALGGLGERSPGVRNRCPLCA